MAMDGLIRVGNGGWLQLSVSKAGFDPVWLCCRDQSDCGDKLICCPAEQVAEYVCDPERVGYCLPACLWIGG